MKMFDDSVPLGTAPTIDLHSIADQLAAQIRHPATIAKPTYHAQACERLGKVVAELELRAHTLLNHVSNKDLRNNLNHIYAIFS